MQSAEQLFGTNLVAMATPMNTDGSLDPSAIDALVDHLVVTGCDGLVVTGTTGESPTLTEYEAAELVRAVSARANGRAQVIAGVGTYDTVGTIRRARDAEEAGADALLLVCPYYSRPTQAGVLAHCFAVADSTELPVMIYDVPARTGMAIETATLIEMAAHPRIRAVKDAKGDLYQAMVVMGSTSLAYYCGIDELNLAYLACGATGLLSVVGNVAAEHTGRLIAAVRAQELESARTIQHSLIGLTDAMLRTSQGAVMSKAALAHLGVIGSAAVRPPLAEAPGLDLQYLAEALAVLGLAPVSVHA